MSSLNNLIEFNEEQKARVISNINEVKNSRFPRKVFILTVIDEQKDLYPVGEVLMKGPFLGLSSVLAFDVESRANSFAEAMLLSQGIRPLVCPFDIDSFKENDLITLYRLVNIPGDNTIDLRATMYKSRYMQNLE